MADSRDVIRERILINVDDKYDKLTGSLTWELSQGLAIELESQYIEIDDALEQKFAGTADFENLKIIAYERGIDWKDATNASGIVKINGVPNTEILIGYVVASDLNEYTVTEENIIGTDGIALVKVECSTKGTIGNTPVNTIIKFPKTYIGLNSVTNETEFTNGYEEENRDSLLQRYYNEVRRPSTSGNANHYQKWAESVEGVGVVKVKPLWNGNGTVKVVILDRNKTIATNELILETYNYIETVRPIGASVTVTTVENLPINISCKVTLKTDYTLQQVSAMATTNLNNYFKDVTFVDSVVYYAKAGNILFNTEGISDIDYNLFKINDSDVNISLIDDNIKTQVPILGVLSLS